MSKSPVIARGPYYARWHADSGADVLYPRSLIEHHLIGGLRMFVLIRNSVEQPGGGTWGIIEGFRFITRERWLTNELDCYRLYPRPGFRKTGARTRRISIARLVN